MNLTAENNCPREDVAAYLDGELSGAALEHFEQHVTQCSECAGELRSQRQLLCTLDAAFNDSTRISLPDNFTRVVAAHAESDLRGLRDRSERRRALQLCALLATAAFAILGAAAGGLVWQPVRSALQIVARVFGVIWQTVFDAAEGVAIIGRLLGRAVITSPHGYGALLAVIFIVAIGLLPRLIASYRRAQIID